MQPLSLEPDLPMDEGLQRELNDLISDIEAKEIGPDISKSRDQDFAQETVKIAEEFLAQTYEAELHPLLQAKKGCPKLEITDNDNVLTQILDDIISTDPLLQSKAFSTNIEKCELDDHDLEEMLRVRKDTLFRDAFHFIYKTPTTPIGVNDISTEAELYGDYFDVVSVIKSISERDDYSYLSVRAIYTSTLTDESRYQKMVVVSKGEGYPYAVLFYEMNDNLSDKPLIFGYCFESDKVILMHESARVQKTDEVIMGMMDKIEDLGALYFDSFYKPKKDPNNSAKTSL